MTYCDVQNVELLPSHPKLLMLPAMPENSAVGSSGSLILCVQQAVLCFCSKNLCISRASKHLGLDLQILATLVLCASSSCMHNSGICCGFGWLTLILDPKADLQTDEQWFLFCPVHRTIRFWDLEKFHVVSCIEEEATPVRYITFLPQ